MPEPSGVETALFLVGDAGDAVEGSSPVLAELGADIEEWSRALGRDSAVAVAFLGDNVYPQGLRDRGHAEFARDSAHLWSQILLLEGEAAREHGSLGLFLPGNHDWGNAIGEMGLRRLRNMEEALERARSRGPRVELVPAAGESGPVVLDLGTKARLLLLDTHWFLQRRPDEQLDRVFEAIADALLSAGDRHVVVLAHHPFRSGGPHGALVPLWTGMGLLYLFKKSGTLVQDLNSPMYRDFGARLRQAFRAGGRAPLVFAGGHDHSLQVIEGSGPTEPVYTLVSGSGSKLTDVSDVPGIVFGVERPGYMLVLFHEDGAVELAVVAGEAVPLHCTGQETEPGACLRQAQSAFRPIYSDTLAPPSVPAAGSSR